MAKARAIGERGSWFAKVNGETFACVHSHWLSGLHHCDPGYVEGERQWDELVSVIRESSRVILTRDEPMPAPEKKSGFVFRRTGYIAVYSVGAVEADADGLKFDLTGRICDLQG